MIHFDAYLDTGNSNSPTAQPRMLRVGAWRGVPVEHECTRQFISTDDLDDIGINEVIRERTGHSPVYLVEHQ